MSNQHNPRQITSQVVKMYLRKLQNSNRPRRMYYIKTVYQNKKKEVKFVEHLILFITQKKKTHPCMVYIQDAIWNVWQWKIFNMHSFLFQYMVL